MITSFDKFCEDLLEESKRFLEKAAELEKLEPDSDGLTAYLHACLLLGFCSLEAYVNNVAEELSISVTIPVHIRGVLLEKDVRLDKGEFQIVDALKMSRLTDRIEVLYRYHKKAVITDEPWWEELKAGVDLRNKITHPKETVEISVERLSRILRAIINCLESLFKAIYKRKFPRSSLGLLSKREF